MLRPALALFFLLTLVTGVLYPLATTAIAQLAFSEKAGGSLIKNKDGEIVGSLLLAQETHDARLFWGRPSATYLYPTNTLASGGSHLNPANPKLREQVSARVEMIRFANPAMINAPLPVDLVTSSASGLDPHISVAAARFQIKRVAQSCGLEETALSDLVDQATEKPFLAFMGPEVVNVLRLNIVVKTLCKRQDFQQDIQSQQTQS